MVTDSDDDMPLARIFKQEIQSDDDLPLARAIIKDSESDDDMPLAKKIKKDNIEEDNPLSVLSEEFVSSSEVDDTDKDSDYCGQCEYKYCKSEIFECCELCDLFFCKQHLTNHKPCFFKKTKKRRERCVKTSSKKTQIVKTAANKQSVNEKRIENNEDNIETQYKSCEVLDCNKEVFAACHRCFILLCWEHFDHNEDCHNHSHIVENYPAVIQENVGTGHLQVSSLRPEDYFIDGGEGRHRPPKSPRKNKRKTAKALRNTGKEYVSPKTNRLAPERKMKPPCNYDSCKRYGKDCHKIDEEGRLAIFSNYYDLGSLQLQREFITRHIEMYDTKQKTTSKDISRRQKSNKYYFMYKTERLHVCKMLFLNTLGISEKTARTAVSKLTSSGFVEPDKRGGRQSQTQAEKEIKNRELINQHINRFPFVESHYCRASSSKNYLHHELSLPKIYQMFKEEYQQVLKKDLPSFSTYRRVFLTKNTSFHRPKKDQCSLCMSYRRGATTEQEKLKSRYDAHNNEKVRVRGIKEDCKASSMKDPTTVTASFDLQQVMYLPITKESALFYKRRLAVYNMTFYNISNKDVTCFTWDETQSKRGSSEISTAVFKALNDLDLKGAKKINLFADGCPGQNNNSIVPTMLLYFLSKSINVDEVSLRFFEPYHGQNEGDSCHSAISYAIKKAGDLFLPSQLHPIFSLARRDNPYKVVSLQWNDFLDYKRMSKDLRILQERDVKGNKEATVDWTTMVEFRVTKKNLNEIQFKTSHLEESYKTITLKRTKHKIQYMTVEQLNKGRVNIPKAKYKDLTSLCEGDTPVVRNEECKRFYRLLPHDD